MVVKALTPAEAEARLPFVAPVVADARQAAEQLEAAVAAYRGERRKALPSQIVLNERKLGIDRLRRAIEECEEELRSAQAGPVDTVRGFADFPGTIDGADVLLCWHFGESRVEYWHGTAEDHATRRLLPVPLPTA